MNTNIDINLREFGIFSDTTSASLGDLHNPLASEPVLFQYKGQSKVQVSRKGVHSVTRMNRSRWHGGTSSIAEGPG